MTRFVSFAFKANYSQKVFNEAQKIAQRNRTPHLKSFPQVQYLRRLIAERLADRLYDIKRPLTSLLDLNGGPGYLKSYLDVEKVKEYHVLDPSRDLLYAGFQLDQQAKSAKSKEQVEEVKEEVEELEEAEMPKVTRWLTQDFYDLDRGTKMLENGQLENEGNRDRNPLVDAIASYVSTHWINDLGLYFHKIYDNLKPEGLFIGAMIGGESLYELRSTFLLVEQQDSALVDLRSRLSPMIHLEDLSNLLQQSGFELVTLDYEVLKILFPSVRHLMKELGLMGESVMPSKEELRKGWLSPSVIRNMEGIYRENFGEKTTEFKSENIGNDSSVIGNQAENSSKSSLIGSEPSHLSETSLMGLPATLELFWWVAWKPSANTPKPLTRGTAKTSLKDIL